MTTKYKLIYFNAKGYGEPIRMLFALAGVEYEDYRFNRAEWTSTIKQTSPTGEAPMLEVDGVIYAQSLSIARYLAKQFGLAGKTALDEFRADMIVDTISDMNVPLTATFTETDKEKKAAGMKKYEEEQLPTSLGNLEKILAANRGGDGYFVGDEVTWADIVFIHYITFPIFMEVKIDWTKIPKLAALNERVSKLPKIAEWIEKRPKTQH